MICRSSVGLLAVAGLLGLAVPAAAQDTVQTVTQDTTQMGAPQQRPQAHVVQTGETLWGLAQQYLADPLLWPEIYRLNTNTVEDPHWIYPGEELLFGAAPEPTSEVAVAPPADTTQAEIPAMPAQPAETTLVEAPPPPPPPAAASSETVFSRRPGGQVLGRLEAAEAAVRLYRPVRRGEFYSAGFLTEGENFPWSHVLGDAEQPALERSVATSSVQIYRNVEIKTNGAATYQSGDSLLLANLWEQVPDWGWAVKPSGIARVTRVDGQTVLAQVVEQFGRVVDGQVAIPLEQFHAPADVRPTEVENGVTGHVVANRDETPVPKQQDIVFIDLGREQGIALGDIVEVRQYGPDPNTPPEPSALLQIVHVRQRSSSGLILQVYRPGISPGDPVQLVRKMPS